MAEASDEGVEVALLLHGEDLRIPSDLGHQWDVHDAPLLEVAIAKVELRHGKVQLGSLHGEGFLAVELDGLLAVDGGQVAALSNPAHSFLHVQVLDVSFEDLPASLAYGQLGAMYSEVHPLLSSD